MIQFDLNIQFNSTTQFDSTIKFNSQVPRLAVKKPCCGAALAQAFRADSFRQSTN